jgi:hypothetical protein
VHSPFLRTSPFEVHPQWSQIHDFLKESDGLLSTHNFLFTVEASAWLTRLGLGATLLPPKGLLEVKVDCIILCVELKLIWILIEPSSGLCCVGSLLVSYHQWLLTPSTHIHHRIDVARCGGVAAKTSTKLQPFALSSLAFGEEVARVSFKKLSWSPRLSFTRAFTSTIKRKARHTPLRQKPLFFRG